MRGRGEKYRGADEHWFRTGTDCRADEMPLYYMVTICQGKSKSFGWFEMERKRISHFFGENEKDQVLLREILSRLSAGG